MVSPPWSLGLLIPSGFVSKHFHECYSAIKSLPKSIPQYNGQFKVGYPLDVEARAAAPALTLDMNLGGFTSKLHRLWEVKR